jgi:hypothetical protein
MYSLYELLFVCESYNGKYYVFLCGVKSTPPAAARARKAPCLVVWDRGVCVCAW